jgi:hypothetical protein
MLVVRTLAEALGVVQFAILIDLVVAVWLHVALGNVLRHALDVPLLAGVLVVLAYTIFAFNLIAQVFPPQVAAPVKIHVLGICGTFMGGLAQIAKAQGHEVSGSDANVYPPMSTQLEAAGITRAGL